MMNKKISAGIEMVLMIVSFFAFGYFLSFDVELVSAEEAGCCSLSNSGKKCATTAADACAETFAESSLCDDTSFCQKGCCFDENTGIYDKNVLKSDCSASWVGDPNCNMPAADLGCCVLGSSSSYETEGQCKTDSLVLALTNGTVDWRGDVNEAGCFILGASQEKGACVIENGDCKFIGEESCLGYDGDFYEGLLCTSPSIESNCKMTEQTKCVDGKDGVYFVDSCGNVANIYDSSRLDDPTYWDEIVSGADVCGSGDVENGNANSPSCGNCDRFAGGICASASEDRKNVDVGDFYCRDMSCVFDGENYKNGESWCVYDGAIGNGDDVVGSRHWKYVCSQGKTQIEPCADYRNQICIMNSDDNDFSNAACVANNWRECINLNGDEDDLAECGEALNCRVESIDIADHFKFDVCLPKYPGGFDLTDERYEATTKSICGMASTNCTVAYAPKTWGGCELVANGGCLTEKFGQDMNDFCRGLGDCGGSANIIGEWSDNYKITRSPDLSTSWITKLLNLALPVEGQFAEVENYSEYLAAAGVMGDLVAPTNEEAEEGFNWNGVGMGMAGIGYAGAVGAQMYLGATLAEASQLSAMKGISLLHGAGGNAVASVGAFAGVAIGAGIGMVAGAMLAKMLELSPGGSMLMAIGGAIVGVFAAGMMLNIAYLAAFGIAGIIVGIILMIIGLLFGGSDCPPTVVTFECKPWVAPVGVADCNECNNDPLKPCSKYRCGSLGAGCELVNVGTNEEMCSSMVDNGQAPVISPRFDVLSNGEKYTNVSSSGFRLSSVDGKCLDAYDPLVFGVETDKLAHCKFDIQERNFEEMNFDLGSNNYVRNHATTFSLPDPSHGESQGSNWSGDLSLFVQCEDVFGTLSKGLYKIEMCVNQGPDVVAPKIVSVSPKADKFVKFDVANLDFEVVTNELATCRWSSTDVSYSVMENNMSCSDSFGAPSNVLGYSCTGNVPLTENDNNYYIRCGDQPWANESDRNFNLESFVYNLKKPGSRIAIDWIRPSEDFESDTDMTTIELEISTSGGGNYHFCSYSFSGYEKMIEMFETGGSPHSQTLNRPIGEHEIFVECSEETGDFARNSTVFEIVKKGDLPPANETPNNTAGITPEIARVWQSGGSLYIYTNNDMMCRASYESCDFSWGDGVNLGNRERHVASVVHGRTYYVRCLEEVVVGSTGCSIVVKAL